MKDHVINNRVTTLVLL